ncbi:LPXTG cell wall anchor domain-containing protein [Collinsella sp. AGMB00827]|uniref:LPXTG cell wall anchor domain-containing protein n=1 Tax=Collinsella ureilytica TaxID=2869515 RepID=A0ABS7MJH1_9ACTN|nr:LPXTG cell wall anchor domain-containing protein [Collinsella urealyticum]MBY4797520.1 LPXTG cell wall anchor domain-containing protein [Collinsella urealyticum]
MRKTHIWLGLAIVFVFVVSLLGGGRASFADTPTTSSWTINFRWKYKDDQPHWGFDEARMGQKVKILMYFPQYGKPAPDAAEQRVPKNKWVAFELTYGEKATFEVTTEATQTIGDTTYTDVRLDQGYLYMTDEAGYARDLAYSTGVSPGTTVQDCLLFQQANTDFRFSLVNGDIHPDDRVETGNKTTIPISIGFNRTYKDKTEPFIGRNGRPIVNTYTFEDAAEHHPSAEYDATHRETLITYATSGNDFDLYSNYTGKYKTYTMTAQFSDTKTTKSANGRYEITGVEGSDLTGWEVKLTSHVKAVTPEAPTVESSTEAGVPGKVLIPKPADPAHPTWTYTQVRVNKAGEPNERGTYVKVTASLVDPVLNYVADGAVCEWTLDISPKAAVITPATPISPTWGDATTPLDTPVVVPLEQGKVQEGTTVDVNGPGTAVLNKDGSITVTPNDQAKIGDVIAVIVKDKNGATIDEFKVSLTKPAKEKLAKKRRLRTAPRLPQTGAIDGIAVLSATSGVLLSAGGMVLAKRRRG